MTTREAQIILLEAIVQNRIDRVESTLSTAEIFNLIALIQELKEMQMNKEKQNNNLLEAEVIEVKLLK